MKRKKREVWKYSEASTLHNLTSANIQCCKLNKGTGKLFKYVSDVDTSSGFNVRNLSPQSNFLRNIRMTENSRESKDAISAQTTSSHYAALSLREGEHVPPGTVGAKRVQDGCRRSVTPQLWRPASVAPAPRCQGSHLAVVPVTAQRDGESVCAGCELGMQPLLYWMD